ncbi:MAG: hypothetical protein JNK47_06390 [Mesorhizobium sp.]|nr:hypothetical protein [Mesorhizobium sp.]MBL8576835.1 hypothetical protein [Mesorhizobium sp.]
MRTILIGMALAAGFATAVPVQAQDLEFRVGPDGLRIDRECNPRYEECYRDGYRNREEPRRRCTEERALNKAERMGLQRVRVEAAGRRTIEVRGRDRFGERIFVTFGRQPSCPILS